MAKDLCIRMGIYILLLKDWGNEHHYKITRQIFEDLAIPLSFK